jgi:hypothetical protein
MKREDIIQINKLSNLHNNFDLIFCKTDYLREEFEKIKLKNHDVVLISGNSDFIIDENLYNLKPENVKKWYAQNAIFTNKILECVPIGIENYLPSIREGHGIGYDRVKIKEEVISSQNQRKPCKFIYSNFNINTNFIERSKIKKISQDVDFIEWEEPNLSVELFFNKILDYEAVVCPQGNGIGDNHRIYEVLYMGRIPITFNKIMYKNIHHLYPVLCLENTNQLYDFNYMREKIDQLKNYKWDKKSLDINFWIDKIKSNGYY